MDINKQKDAVKNLRTAIKFIRISKTMLENARNGILEDNAESVLPGRIAEHIAALSEISDTFDDTVVEKFKTEQLMPGCQFELNFGE